MQVRWFCEERLMLYYLGIPVEIVIGKNQKGFLPRNEDWVNARWPDGKIWTHIRDQLKERP